MEKLKASIFLHIIGEDALDIYNSFQLDEASLTLTTLMTKFEEYFSLVSFLPMTRNKAYLLIST